ncbi:MAG: GAF domain-containing protein, partial [Deltaproteobacteria bacterium]
SLSLERVAHLGLDYARKLTGSTLGFVGFVDSRTGNLVAPVYSGDVWAGGESKTPVFSRERGLIGWILREGKPLIVNDVASDPRFPGVPEGHEAIERLIALPIFSQDELIGIIALANAERDYTNEDRRVLERISSLLSIAVLRLKAEDALASSEKRFRSLVESAHFGTLILRERKVSYMSSALKELFGHVPSPFSFKEIQGIHPEDVERLERVLHRVEEVGIEALDTEFRYFPPSSDGGKRRMKWIYCRLKRVKYEDGTALLLNFIDITKAKEAEMLINDRLMSLGRITAGIAHEIKNPLSGINIYLKALKRVLEEGEDPEKGLYIIEQIRAASERIDSVIRQTMDFSRPTPPRFRPLNLNEAVRGALNLVGGTVKKGGVELETDLAPHLPKCYGDPQLLSQVVMNLVTNAAEAMRNHDGTKKILIRTEAGEETVVLKVSDSGPGIPPENRNRIFEPFFTTKSDTTGLGLSICSRIILDHGGTITVGESEMGGAEFTIEIPLDRRRSRR